MVRYAHIRSKQAHKTEDPNKFQSVWERWQDKILHRQKQRIRLFECLRHDTGGMISQVINALKS